MQSAPAQQAHDEQPATQQPGPQNESRVRFEDFPLVPQGPQGIDTHAVAAAGIRGSSGKLPYLERIQRAFGAQHDLTSIRARVGGSAGQASRRMGAEAFTFGNQVGFERPPRLHTAAHEAAHVLQQRAGLPLGRGEASERHADAVADLVVRGQPAAPALAGLQTGRGAAPAVAVQLKKNWRTRLNELYRAHERLNREESNTDSTGYLALRNYVNSLPENEQKELSEELSLKGETRDTKSDTKAKRTGLRLAQLIKFISNRERGLATQKVLPPSTLSKVSAAQRQQTTGKRLSDLLIRDLHLQPVGSADIDVYGAAYSVPIRRREASVLYRPDRPVTAYHVTRSRYVDSILKTGLNPGKGGGEGAVGTGGEYNAPGYVYLTNTIPNAKGIGRSFYGKSVGNNRQSIMAVTLTIDDIVVYDPDFQTTAFRIAGLIPANQIRVFADIDDGTIVDRTTEEDERSLINQQETKL